jgi:hypothetical protein
MSSVNVYAADDISNKVIGKWEVTLIYSSFGTGQSFFLDIREVDKKIVFDIQNGDLDIKEMRLIEKNGKLSANIYNGEFMKLIIWEENGAIKGTFQIPMIGDLSLLFKKTN